MPGERPEEVGIAARRVWHLVAEHVARGAAASADGVMPTPHRVRDDREELGRAYRVDAVAGAQVDVLVVLHGVRRVVAVGRVVRVVAEEVDRLLALEVHDPQRLPRDEDSGPVVVGGDHLVQQDFALHGLLPSSLTWVNVTPRARQLARAVIGPDLSGALSGQALHETPTPKSTAAKEPMANAPSTDRASIAAGVDGTEPRQLNEAREKGIAEA